MIAIHPEKPAHPRKHRARARARHWAREHGDGASRRDAGRAFLWDNDSGALHTKDALAEAFGQNYLLAATSADAAEEDADDKETAFTDGFILQRSATAKDGTPRAARLRACRVWRECCGANTGAPSGVNGEVSCVNSTTS